MRDIIPFAKKYRKLTYNRFTTIRGLTWEADLKKTDGVFHIVRKQKYLGVATLICYKKLSINRIPRDLLRWDVYPDKIHSYQDFLNLLNKYRQYNKLVNVYSQVLILLLEKLGDW